MPTAARYICTIKDCYNVNYCYTMCAKHYRWWRDHGKPRKPDGSFKLPAYLSKISQYKHGKYTNEALEKLRIERAARKKRREWSRKQSESHKARFNPNWREAEAEKMRKKVEQGKFEERTCEFCTKVFFFEICMWNPGRFCSQGCYWAARRKYNTSDARPKPE